MKVTTEEVAKISDFDPWLDLKDALVDLGVDWTAPDFKEESLILLFENASKNNAH